MNKQRRKRLDALNLEHIKTELETIRDEEQEAFDNMPESIQNGERGEKAQEWVDGMEGVIDAIDTLTSVD